MTGRIGKLITPSSFNNPVSTEENSVRNHVVRSDSPTSIADSEDDLNRSELQQFRRISSKPCDHDSNTREASRSNKKSTGAPRGSRMLRGLGLPFVPLGTSLDEDDDEDDVFQQRVTGLKRPTPDSKATRRSSRRQAKKPVVYDMRVHPQDHALPFRRTTTALHKVHGDSDESDGYKPALDDAAEDVIRVIRSDDEDEAEDEDEADEADLDLLDVTDARGFKLPTHDHHAKRRSLRSAAQKPVNYNLKIHPNDVDIGIRHKTKKGKASNSTQRRLNDENVNDNGNFNGRIMGHALLPRARMSQEEDNRSRSHTYPPPQSSYHNRAVSVELGHYLTQATDRTDYDDVLLNDIFGSQLLWNTNSAQDNTEENPHASNRDSETLSGDDDSDTIVVSQVRASQKGETLQQSRAMRLKQSRSQPC